MVIVSRKSGRMGNRLFTFAHFMANSLEYGPYPVFNPVFNEYSTFFVGTDSGWLTRFVPSAAATAAQPCAVRRQVRTILDYLIYALTNPLRRGRIAILRSPFHEVLDLHHPESYDWQHSGFLQFVQQKIVISNGWIFWDHPSFIKHAAAIRDYFHLTPVWAERVRQYLNECRQQDPILVGVHIRHGDYLTAGGGTFYYQTTDYVALMQRINRQSNRPVRFLVCSDEPLQPADFAGLDIRPGPGSPIEDMYCLAGCDYILGPPSSFSGWASFYGQTPLYFITDLTTALQTLTLTDFVPLDSFDYRTTSSRYEGGEAAKQ